MKGQFLQKVSSSLSKTAGKVKQASPELLVIGGAIGVIAAAVGACCATRKIDTIVEEHKADVEKIHEFEDNDNIPEYTHKDAQKDLTITYAKTAWKIVKLYAPSVILGAASLGCMLASNQILRKRNASLAAAYAAVDGAFKKYRKAVIERFGEQVDKELRFNTKAQEVTKEIVDENGKKKKVKETIQVAQGDPDLSSYARCFDETNSHYKANPQNNRYFLQSMEKSFNDLLWARGYVFLNEVYEALGFEKTQAGQRVGWWRDGNGDRRISFGIFDVMRERNKDFELGYEPAVWLDFNVDGVIDNKIFREI